jgi:hypothetical protein
MAGKGIFEMSQRDLKRLHIVRKAIEREIKQTEAAAILCLSARQMRRLIRRVLQEGDGGIIHKARGKASNRVILPGVKKAAIELYRSKYEGFGPTLASEKLLELDGISVNDETLRNWLILSGDWKKTRKDRRHRRWRERKYHFGKMVQIDGSHHDWFEGRGSKCVLMGYIDDATGKVFGRFYGHEGTAPAMDSFKRYIRKYGIPVSIYLDKHNTYKAQAKQSLKDDTEPLSEFQRAMEELGVRVIHAHSPQAKGRIERLFRTFQDRVIKEMRLRGIKTIQEANTFLPKYLPIYNRRFAVKPREKADLHRPVPKELNLDSIFCLKTERVLRNDFTVSFNSKLYQIEDKIKATRVIVQERLDGTMLITHENSPLKFSEITQMPQKPKPVPIRRTHVHSKPLADHPWRKKTFKRTYKKNNWLWDKKWA